MKTVKPKCYKYPLYIPKEVYEFMISPKGVGSARTLFGLYGTGKHYHDSTERHSYYKAIYVAWYKRRCDVIKVLIWLIDWYHAAKNPVDHVCYFPNWDLICNLFEDGKLYL